VPSQPNRYSYKLVDILSKEVEEGLDLEGVWKATLFTNPEKPANWEKYETIVQIAILRRVVLGRLACNQGYSSIEYIKGNEIRMKSLVATMLPCYDPDEIRYDYFAWGEIFKTKTYKVTGTKLELFDETGALQVEFEKVKP
jgi:heat shock protein HslJ